MTQKILCILTHSKVGSLAASWEVLLEQPILVAGPEYRGREYGRPVAGWEVLLGRPIVLWPARSTGDVFRIVMKEADDSVSA